MLFFEDRQPFATGATTYSYQPATGEESSPRISIRVAFEGMVTTAVVDTGSPFVILDPNIAETIHVEIQSGIPQNNIMFRTSRLDGFLHRMNLLLLAEQGENLIVDATVFIPELKPYQEWGDFPSIIGLNSCLERLRFAVDPAQDRFYFGDLP